MKWVRQRGAAALVLFLVLGLMGLASLRTKRHRKAIGDRETIECGVLRAKVKSGTDANAPGINLVATPTTIAALTALEPHHRSERTGVELQTFRLEGVTLEGLRNEPDGDIHVILSEGGRTMVAEVPSMDCGASDSRFAAQLQTARKHVFDNWRRWQARRGKLTVTVEGVAFFDFEHHQTGVAANGIELHPVTRICAGWWDCWWN